MKRQQYRTHIHRPNSQAMHSGNLRFSIIQKFFRKRWRWLLPAVVVTVLLLVRGCSAPEEMGLDQVLARYGQSAEGVGNYRCTRGAHRGASLEHRENTIAALTSAENDRRYAFIEFDVQYSKDGRIIVHHDLRLLRLFGSFRSVGETAYEKLVEVTKGEIAAYEDVIDVLDKRLNIEIKSQGDTLEDCRLADEIISDLRRRERLDDVLISSISGEVISYIKQSYPSVATGKIFWLTSATYLPFDTLTVNLYEEIAETRADYLMLHVENLRNIGDLLRLKPEGKKLAFWDFDDNIYVVHMGINDRLWGRSAVAALFHEIRFRLLTLFGLK